LDDFSIVPVVFITPAALRSLSESGLDFFIQELLKRAKTYPLEMGIIYPVFSWGAHFNQDQKLLGLINNISKQEIDNNASFRKIGQYFYKVIEDVELSGETLLAGDILRVDGIEKWQLKKARHALKKMQKKFTDNSFKETSFFSYDTNAFTRLKI